MTTDNTKALPLQVRIKEAARLLDYSESMIYKLLKERKIRSVGSGRLRRIPTAELLRFQKEQGYDGD